MKKFITYIALLSTVLYSCKKNHSGSQTPSDKLYKVSFGVNGFSQQLANFSLKQSSAGKSYAVSGPRVAASLSDNITDLYYIVYNSGGTILHTIHQKSTQTDFGNIIDNLGTGTYTVVIVGGQTNLDPAGFTSANLGDAAVAYLLPSPSNGVSPGYNDMFIKKLTLNVTGSDINQSVALDRIVGQVKLNVEDVLPSKTVYMVMTVSNESRKYFISTGVAETPVISTVPGQSTGNTVKMSQTIDNADKGKTNYNKLSILLLNTVSPVSVKIEAFNDYSGIPFAAKTISNVTCQPNKITLLSGAVFGGSGINGNVKVNIDTAWSSSSTIHF